jgi:hypothetical protein
MSGVFDFDIFDPDIFDCGDGGLGPVEETPEEARVTGKLCLTSAVSQLVFCKSRIWLRTGDVPTASVSGALELRTEA